MNIAVFDVGGTFIKHCLMIDGKITQAGKIPTPQDSQESFLKAIKAVLDKMSNIEGIAFSLPGVIDVYRQYIYAGGSLRYNDHCDLKEWENYFNLPIQAENDARCAAIAELEQGNMQGIQNGLVLTFGTGVGGGIIINGDIFKGSHLISGEVSMIFAHRISDVTNHHLFGALGSIKNLIDKIAAAKGVKTDDGRLIFDWIKTGDLISCELFDDYCDDVIWQLHNIQCILDPQRICIGGGVSENQIFIDRIKTAVKRFYQSLPIPFPQPEIVKCKYCNDANMVGAYLHYLRKNDER